MPIGLERLREEIGIFIGSPCSCIRYASFSLNNLFIALTLLKLISLILGCILILYLNFYCTDYVFCFTFTPLTSG